MNNPFDPLSIHKSHMKKIYFVQDPESVNEQVLLNKNRKHLLHNVDAAIHNEDHNELQNQLHMVTRYLYTQKMTIPYIIKNTNSPDVRASILKHISCDKLLKTTLNDDDIRGILFEKYTITAQDLRYDPQTTLRANCRFEKYYRIFKLYLIKVGHRVPYKEYDADNGGDLDFSYNVISSEGGDSGLSDYDNYMDVLDSDSESGSETMLEKEANSIVNEIGSLSNDLSNVPDSDVPDSDEEGEYSGDSEGKKMHIKEKDDNQSFDENELACIKFTLNEARSYQNYALHYACYRGNFELFMLLVNAGLTDDDFRSKDNFALRVASSRGHTDIVKELMKTLTFEDIKTRNFYAIRYACKKNNFKIVEMLIKEMNPSDIENARLLVILCTHNVSSNAVKIVKLIIVKLTEMGLNQINISEAFGYLFEREGSKPKMEPIEMVKAMIPYVTPGTLRKCITQIIKNNSIEILKMIMKTLSVDDLRRCMDYSGTEWLSSKLDEFYESSDDEEKQEYIEPNFHENIIHRPTHKPDRIRIKVNIDHEEEGKTHIYYQKSSYPLRTLIKRHRNLYSLTKNYKFMFNGKMITATQTPDDLGIKDWDSLDIKELRTDCLLIAAQHSNEHMMRYLFTYGFNVSDVRNISNQALIEAVRRQHYGIVRFLLSKGLTIKDIRAQGNLALILASSRKKTNDESYLITKCLLSYGLTIEDIRAQNNLALKYAIYTHNLPVVKMFLRRGVTAGDLHKIDGLNQVIIGAKDRYSNYGGHELLTSTLLQRLTTTDPDVFSKALKLACEKGYYDDARMITMKVQKSVKWLQLIENALAIVESHVAAKNPQERKLLIERLNKIINALSQLKKRKRDEKSGTSKNKSVKRQHSDSDSKSVSFKRQHSDSDSKSVSSDSDSKSDSDSDSDH